MSVSSNIGSVFGSLGSGVATVGGPVGMGVGAGFSVLGGIIGLAGKIKERKREEEEKQRQLAEAQRQAAGETSEAVAESAATDVTRAQSAQQTAQRQSGQVQPVSRARLHDPTMNKPGYPQMMEEEVMGPELKNMFAQAQPGQGSFFNG